MLFKSCTLLFRLLELPSLSKSPSSVGRPAQLSCVIHGVALVLEESLVAKMSGEAILIQFLALVGGRSMEWHDS